MDRRRFFTGRTLTESVVTNKQKETLFEDTMAELSKLYEDAENQEEVAEQNVNTEEADTSNEAAPEAAPEATPEDAKEVLAELKDSDYEEFVKILNSDGKSKAFLDYLRQHYKLGDDAIKTVKQAQASEGTVKCSQLQPTQKNISLSKSLGIMKTNPAWTKKIIETPEAAFDTPTVTYAGKFIIDGHHRWSKAYALNGGDSTIKVLNFPAIDGVTWEDMLKAVQLAIVNTNPSASLINKVGDDNMLTMDSEAIYKFAVDNMADEIVETLKAKGRGDDKEAAAKKIAENVVGMQNSSQPVEGAAKRDFMPQMDDEGKAEAQLKKAVIDLT